MPLIPTEQLEEVHLDGEQHTHEETQKDSVSTEDGTVTVEKTETTEAETNGDE